ncbi:hypothetical protein I8B06_004012 [Vibrio vulnificus]|nr:hypothetical protein [Vibrio vulnificus]
MFQDKHVFFVNIEDNFIYLNVDALIYRAGVEPSNIVIVFFGKSDGFYKVRKIVGVEYFLFDDINIKDVIFSKTITFISINANNASYISKIIDIDACVCDKTYILITDDEVERWGRCVDVHGAIKKDKALNISSEEVEVTSKIKWFIGNSNTFGDKIRNALKRNDFKLINAGIIFDTLPVNESNCFSDLLSRCEAWNGKEKKILIGTKKKSFSIREVKAVMRSLCKFKLGEEYKVLIMWHKKNRKQRLLLDLYTIWLRHFKQQTLDISYVTELSPLAYTSLISSCSHIILQKRGGASTVRTYLKFGAGVVCIPSGTDNEFGFKRALDLDVISFDSTDDLMKKIINSKIDIKYNESCTRMEELRSASVLSMLYN